MIRTVAGRRWHSEGKYWTVPATDGALEHLLALFADQPVEVDPALQPANVRDDQPARTDPESPDMAAPPTGRFDRVRQAIRARHYSPRTEQAYLAWIARFVRFHDKRRPEDMGEPEVNEFLTHLAVDERVAASTQNQALAALLFLYESVLHRPLGRIEGVVRARRPRRLPVVLTRPEVRPMLDGLDGTPRLVCMLLYGSGLRLLECLCLR
ncbi:MAG: site-specific integrase, partial [bacterium]